MTAPLSILHLHASFGTGGKEARAARLMAAWGPRARHVIVSGDPDSLDGRAMIGPGVTYEVAQNAPPLAGKPSVARYEAIARLMRRFDLVLTYGWGAIDGVMARRVFGKDMPPLIHHEDGFGAEEADGLKIERNLYRRVALTAAQGLVVPSEALEGIALGAWKQPRDRVHRIVNGIATAHYRADPDPAAIPGLTRRDGEVLIGAVAALQPVKNLTALVRAAGGLSGRFRLVIVGEGPERAAIEDAARAMGIADRLVMPGFVERPYRFLRLFDLVAMSSLSEQFPTSVVEAMAAGLPVAALPVGDLRRMVSADNAPFIAEWPTEVRLRDVMQALVNDAALRAQVGAANRARAVAEYDEAVMIARYRDLYEGALGRPGALS
ncbi:glycosyltransferase family 4 protein [Sphingomonas mollis]|uniref:Glycosyltransferase family 4 protein n=1 Tax=Sphingomonas mollis TaxID=2795726 RepID=A0ABS0XPC0_9SPHN|nr:glycosyltransferase family 4 protein [Sphingomonas sp. BT553]MBJ6121886.1 glycosyltransferase family 4 protein [Sphingomonas sp. BT553]